MIDTERKQKLIRRWSLFIMILTGLFWGAWRLLAGTVPTPANPGLGMISRWWDILAAPAWACVLLSLVGSEWAGKHRRWFLFSLGAGTLYGLALVLFIAEPMRELAMGMFAGAGLVLCATIFTCAIQGTARSRGSVPKTDAWLGNILESAAFFLFVGTAALGLLKGFLPVLILGLAGMALTLAGMAVAILFVLFIVVVSWMIDRSIAALKFIRGWLLAKN